MEQLTLAQYLRYRRELAHEELVVETPPACLTLWDRATAADCRLGLLYVLRRPLAAGVGGAYDPHSGDIWVLHDPAQPERTARFLLHELAHAFQPPAAPAATIDAYCDEEAATEQRARTLAAAWDVAGLMDLADLEDALAAIEELRSHLTAAGALGGTLHPDAARRASAAVCRLAGQEGWGRAVLDDALFGCVDHPTANVRVLDFDRCILRGRWRLAGHAASDFGRLTLAPDETSASLLRSALHAVANPRDRPAAAFVERRGERTPRSHFAFLRLEERHDLPTILAAANAALLGLEASYAMATWDCFGDAADTRGQRLYRLWVQYGGNGGTAPSPDVHLWVLALPRRANGLRAEAALQQYIGGWRASTSLRVECWWQGLAEFAAYEQTAQ